ncbi:hypothetical protein SR870_11950 [Rhodopseudomonas palustris]|uniref:hypothetical protein n=1 Tax=Rhodopseudomonas palustris TaxID=1076 RepID=UPI002ACE4D3D|nr:hypothetical protein [Rhodopseudomonas palustris]WQH01945.1 hypothetical protein SR870_11950 [Rhodopseudomonas palustris]
MRARPSGVDVRPGGFAGASGMNAIRLALAGGAFWLVGAMVFFRQSWASRLDVVTGDLGDGRLITFLHEHLYDWLRGAAAFRSPDYFHPQRLTLGFTDSFLLDVLPYSLFRSLGADAYLAMLLLDVSLSLMCFAAAAVVLLRYFRVTPLIAFAAALLITFPNNLFFKASIGHLNFFGLYWVPVIGLLALWAFDGFPRPTRWSYLRGFVAGLLYALLFSSAYYVAWLFALTLLIAAICAGVIALRRGAIAIDRRGGVALAGLSAVAAAGFVIGLSSFVYIYGPVLAIFPGRSFADYLAFAPHPIDLLNVSRHNLMWGSLVREMVGPVVSDDGERGLAVTPILLLAFVGFSTGLLRRDPAAAASRPRWEALFVWASLGVFVLSWLLTVQVGGTSAFALLYKTIPGAVAIRTGGRIQLLVNLWVVCGLALALDRWIAAARPDARLKRVVPAGLLLALCAAEQLNRNRSVLTRSGQRALLASMPPAPADCRSFFIDRPTDLRLFQFDALAIAQATGLPTLNGSSGVFPPDWGFWNYDAGYLPAVQRWIDAHRLTGVCSYDQTDRRWRVRVRD